MILRGKHPGKFGFIGRILLHFIVPISASTVTVFARHFRQLHAIYFSSRVADSQIKMNVHRLTIICPINMFYSASDSVGTGPAEVVCYTSLTHILP